MDLLRDWRRRVLGGTAAALLVPVGIVGAALAIGLGGGFGGLGALGQAFTGPEVPGVEPASARTAAGDGDDDPGDLVAVATPTATPGSAAARRRSRTARRRRSGSNRPGPQRGNGNRPGGRPTPGAPQPQPTSAPQPTPAPTEPPSTVRQVGNQVKEVTDDVPIAGEPAGQVVDTIVETAEQLPLPKVPGVLP